MTSLHERCRPATWADLAGQPQILTTLNRLRNGGGLPGRAFWVNGFSGTGKTSIARLLAQECCDPAYIDEIDGTSLSTGYLDGVENTLRYRPMLGKAYCWIINEAHRVRADLITRLLVMLDPVPDHALWVFTTTSAAQKELWDRKVDAAPFLSRCVKLKTRTDTLEFAIRARQIAREAGLDGKPLEEYVWLVKRCEGNLRTVIQEIENGEML